MVGLRVCIVQSYQKWRDHLRFVSQRVEKDESSMLMTDTMVWVTQNPFQTSSNVHSYRLEAEKTTVSRLSSAMLPGMI